MSIQLKKVVVDVDFITKHGQVIYNRDEHIDLSDLIGKCDPKAKAPLYPEEAREIDIPIFDQKGQTSIVRNVGPKGAYYLWLRPYYFLSKFIVEPDDVFVDLTYVEERLVYCFYNGTRRDCISITALVEEDNEGVAGKLVSNINDGIWRQYIVRKSLMKPDTRPLVNPAEDYPDILTAVQVARFLGVEEKTVRNWTSDGKIPFTKVGSATRYRKVAVAAAFDAGEIGNATKWKKPPPATSKGTKKTDKAP